MDYDCQLLAKYSSDLLSQGSQKNVVCSHMMSVVGKSTCSGFKTGLYISYYGGNAVKQKGYFMKDPGISGDFDIKYMTVLRIEQGKFSHDTHHISMTH